MENLRYQTPGSQSGECRNHVKYFGPCICHRLSHHGNTSTSGPTDSIHVNGHVYIAVSRSSSCVYETNVTGHAYVAVAQPAVCLEWKMTGQSTVTVTKTSLNTTPCSAVNRASLKVKWSCVDRGMSSESTCLCACLLWTTERSSSWDAGWSGCCLIVLQLHQHSLCCGFNISAQTSIVTVFGVQSVCETMTSRLGLSPLLKS